MDWMRRKWSGVGRGGRRLRAEEGSRRKKEKRSREVRARTGRRGSELRRGRRRER